MLGERVAHYRRLNGWSAEVLADLTHDASITRDVIANIEYGRRKDVGVMQLWAIARALRVPLVSLLIPIDDPDGHIDIGMQGQSVLEAVAESQAWYRAHQPPSAQQAHAQLAALRTYDRLRRTLNDSSEELYGADPIGSAGAAESRLLVESWEADRQALDDHITVMRALGIKVKADG